jgi:superfamily II RNA helicase
MPIICSPVFPQIEEENPEDDISQHFREFAYELSDFQKHAIKAIVNGHHVLVCAPTGSGKTLPAEFAIRHFIRQGRRVIYTSPIKALSNQKYHEFSKKFAAFGITVGLCTGDIKTNPTADLLIMTAEILNNRLFQMTESSQPSNQSNLSFAMNLETELAAVIMDEVHYINDESRGHVWEQTILTLPPQIQMIMLSATLDGPEKFAEWIESTRPKDDPKKVYLAQTITRIVPLSHYAYVPPAPLAITKAVKTTPLEPLVKNHTNKLITLQTANGVFQPTGYKTAAKLCDIWADNTSGPVSRKNVLNSLAAFMKGSDDPDVDDTMLPAIVFTLSRKQVEESAADITANILAFDSKIPYNAAYECEQILRRLPNWREYAELPEYKSLVKLLEKGVGIHHSGMIPILREIVEFRISEKKIFMLFATESFAIGLDCPIRTAVFTGLSKFDGSEDRFLYAHEYTQMAGRAGRRGIDKVGHVIHLPLLFRRGIPSELTFRDILSGRPQKLVSKFHIDYKMVLSLLKKGIDQKFEGFVELSMTKTTIVNETNTIQKEIDKQRAELSAMQNGLQYMRTPLANCKEYRSLIDQLTFATNKKRKEIDRKLTDMKGQYKYIAEDIRLLERIEMAETSISQKDRELEGTASYLKTQTDKICDILLETGILSYNSSDGIYSFAQPLGIIAAQFAEVHPIPLAKIIVSENWFQGWSAIQMVGFLSSFVDIRLPENQRNVGPTCDDAKVKNAVVKLQDFYNDIRDREIAQGCHTGIEYEGAICFDMADKMMEWCVLSDEVECKTYLREDNECKISTGDFAKACMKLSAIAKELIAMCEVLTPFVGSNATELAYTLSGIDALILKHIATTQSLYLYHST